MDIRYDGFHTLQTLLLMVPDHVLLLRNHVRAITAAAGKFRLNRPPNGVWSAVAITAGLWTACCLLLCLPLKAGRPLLDVTSRVVEVVSVTMDATGVMHYADNDTLKVLHPGSVISIQSFLPLAALLGGASLSLLVYTTVNALSKRRLVILLIGSLPVIPMINGGCMYLTALIFALTGIDLTSGFPWMLGSILNISLAGGLFYLQVLGITWAVNRWPDRINDPGIGTSWQATAQNRKQGRRPAILVLMIYLGVSLIWAYGRGLTRESLITSYRQTAGDRLANQDLVTASAAIDRLLQLDASAPAHKLLQARLLDSQGQSDAAEQIVRSIVQSRTRQYAPAHRWLAERAVHRTSSTSDSVSPAPNAADLSQLSLTTNLDPADVNAHMALAEAYLTRHSPLQAIQELEQAVELRPDLRLTLARLLVLSGQVEKGRQQGESARDYYQQEVDIHPLAREPRLHLAASLVFLEQFQAATDNLLRGWELTSDSCYHEALGTTYVVWHDTAIRSGAGTTVLLDLLKTSLEYTPENEQALIRVTVMATAEDRKGPAIELLTQSLNRRPIPACVHCALGTNAYRHGRTDNALRHLEEAYRLDPADMETLNNLAWVLAHSTPPQLERALQLANEAVHKNPNIASPRETRGQILAKLGKWSLAVADLENALQVMQNSPAIHATLADAYSELGDPSLAAKHRQMAGELRELH